ncbi:hypothetical protein F5X96DRAFT_669722 [Biscogniauxia mediterranea]|nr:hypothetical protein F5X96DRAFT_669722 [Biscogniauxia mediterranea]
MPSQGPYARPGRKYAQPHSNGGANNGSFHNKVIPNNTPNTGFAHGQNHDFGHANHNQNNNNNNTVAINPNYKGRPENYNPNFKKYPPRNDYTHQNFQAQQNQPQQPNQTNNNNSKTHPAGHPPHPPPFAPKGPSNHNHHNPNHNHNHNNPNTTPFSAPPRPLVDPRDPAVLHAALSELLRRGPDADGDEWMCPCPGGAETAVVVTCRDGAAAAHVALARRHEALRDDVRELFARMRTGQGMGLGQTAAWLAAERPGSEEEEQEQEQEEEQG